jgi:hypothetical protein
LVKQRAVSCGNKVIVTENLGIEFLIRKELKVGERRVWGNNEMTAMFSKKNGERF